ncbi:MAG: EI24 domain-containing protein [Thermodesulfobacteriota bacterium]
MKRSFFLLQLLAGLWAPLRGLGYLRKNRPLWRYVWIPAMINVLLFAALGTLFFFLFPHLVGLILPEGEAWYLTALRGILWAVGSLMVLLLFLLTFTTIGAVIAGPFNELLSERVEQIQGGTLPRETGSIWQQARRSARSAWESIKHLAVYLLGSLILLLWNLLPGIGSVIYTVVATLWTLLFLALEFGDYYLARHWVLFRTRWRKLWRHLWASLGFGAGCALLLMIPVLNLFLMPGAVAGGTLLWMKLEPPEDKRR